MGGGQQSSPIALETAATQGLLEFSPGDPSVAVTIDPSQLSLESAEILARSKRLGGSARGRVGIDLAALGPPLLTLIVAAHIQPFVAKDRAVAFHHGSTPDDDLLSRLAPTERTASELPTAGTIYDLIRISRHSLEG